MHRWRRLWLGMARLWREWPFWRGLNVDWRGIPSGRPHRNSIAVLLRYFGPRWPTVMWVVLNVVFGASLGVLPPLYVRNIINKALPHHQVGVLAADVGLLLIVQMAVGLTGAIGSYLYAWATNGVVRDVRRDVVNGFLDAPPERLEATTASEAASRTVNDIGVVGGNSAVFNGITGIFSSMLAVVGATTTVVSTLIVMFRLDAMLACGVVALLLPFLILARSMARWLYAVTRRQYEVLAALHRRVTRAARASGVMTLRLFAREEAEIAGFVRENAVLADLGTFARFIARQFNNLYAMGPALGVALIWWIGAHAIFRGTMHLGTVLALVAYVNRITKPVSTLSDIFINVRGIQAVGDRIEPLLVADKGGTAPGSQAAVADPPAFRKEARAGVLCVQLDGRQATARPGSPLWVVCSAAAGRQRLRQVLCGARVPEHGTVLLDGMALTGPDGPRGGEVSLVQRHGVLWGRTLADHLGIASPDSHHERARAEEVLVSVGLADWYAELARGLDHALADLRLTSRQEFAMSLAAARVRGAALLVVDGTDPVSREIEWSRLHCTAVCLAASLQQVPADANTSVMEYGSPTADDMVEIAEEADDAGPEALAVVSPPEPWPSVWTRLRAGLGGMWGRLGVQMRWLPPAGRRGSVMRLSRYYYPYWPYWILVILMALVAIGGLTQFAPLFIRMLIDQALPHKNVHLLLLGIGMGVLAPPLVHEVTGVISTIAHETMSNRALRDMRTEAYEHVMRRPATFFRRHSPDQLLTRMINDVNSVYVGAADIANATWMLIPVLPALVIMFTLSAKLAPLLLLGVIPTAVVTYLIGQARYPLTGRTFEVVSDINRQLARVCSVDGSLAVRMAGAREMERAAFTRTNQELFALGLATNALTVLFQLTVAWVSAGVTALLWWRGGLGAIAGHLTVGTLVALATYVSAMEQLHGAFTIYSDLKSVQSNCDRIFEYMDAEAPAREQPDATTQSPVQVRLGPLPGALGDETVTVPPGGRVRFVVAPGTDVLQLATRILGLSSAVPLIAAVADEALVPPVPAWPGFVAVLSHRYPVEEGRTYGELLGREGEPARAALRRAGLHVDPEERPSQPAEDETRFRLSLAAALLRTDAWLWLVDGRGGGAGDAVAEQAGERGVLFFSDAAEVSG